MFKQEKRVVINNYSFDASEGFFIAVRLHHVYNATLAVSISEDHLVMFTASVADPQPLYDLPEPDPTETGES